MFGQKYIKNIYRFLIRKRYQFVIVFSVCILMALFGQYVLSTEQKYGDSFAESEIFRYPKMPVEFMIPSETADYMVKHYWENFDFRDTLLISNPQYAERSFVTFIDLFPHANITAVDESICDTLDMALDGSLDMFQYFVDLYEKYLYHPESPYYNEDYYIFVLHYMQSMDNLDPVSKVSSGHQLELAMKNRPGNLAFDFEIRTSTHKKLHMYSVQSDYTILFFNDPDSPDCTKVREILKTSPVIEKKMKQKGASGITIIAVYTDTDLDSWRKSEYPDNWINGYSKTIAERQLYDLRAMPSLYLLNDKKQVILKDA